MGHPDRLDRTARELSRARDAFNPRLAVPRLPPGIVTADDSNLTYNAAY